MRWKPVFQCVTRRRVPSGATTTQSGAPAANSAATRSAKPSAECRSTGMPPTPRMSSPNGKRNSVCLAMKRTRSPSAHLAARPNQKSQFEVWGATISTHWAMSGKSPSIRHLARRSTSAPSGRVRRPSLFGMRGPRIGTTSSALLSAAVVAGAQSAQQAEAVDAGRVPIAPGEGDRVVADSLEMDDILVLQIEVAGLERVTLAHRTGAPAPQVIEAVAREVAVVPLHHQTPVRLLVADLDRLRNGRR